MSKKPEILDTEVVTKSRLFTVQGLHLRFSNNEERNYERIIGPARGSVLIVPLLDDNTMILIREYAAGIDEYVLSFPKGAVDPGEELMETANRELQEEVGYGARDISLLTVFSTSPGYFSAKMHVVLAKDLYESRLPGDEPEPIEVVPWSLDKIDELLARDDFHEARSVAALLLVLRSKHG